jgi:malate synthase
LWEWVHKGASITEDDLSTQVKANDRFDVVLFKKLLLEEYNKLLTANDKDVHDNSKTSPLPISKEICERYVVEDTKSPWFIDLLNINLNNLDLKEAKRRIQLYMDAFKHSGYRITENLDVQ